MAQVFIFGDSTLVIQGLQAVLGEHVHTSFLENKRIEWENYRSQVTDYELKRYLPAL